MIIPAYNRFRKLIYAVESVLAPTLALSEVIIIDDGSVGEIREMIRRFIAEKVAWHECVHYFGTKIRDKVPLVSMALQGQEVNGWHLMTATIWLPQQLEWQFRSLEESKGRCGFCFTDA